jgi:uncharacterized membrane protein
MSGPTAFLVDHVAASVAVGIIVLRITGGMVLDVVLVVVADGALVTEESKLLGVLDVGVLVTLGDRMLTGMSGCAVFEALPGS